MTTFRYTPLKPNEVRLLKPTSDGGLNFELVHKVIDTRPRYSALSYTWGEPEPCEAIVLDGQHFTVRQNLHDALQRLTSRARGRSRLIAKGSLFWVDALCIDQSNLTERSQEVRMMRQIYEQAQRVFVWLGEPENTRHSDLAERKLKEFAKLQRNAQLENHGYHPWWLPKKAPRWQEEVYQAEISVLGYRSSPAFRIFWDGEGSKTQQAWLGIIDMWRKRWWGRTWIFQEATISQKMSTFYISLPWGSSWMNPIQSKVLFLCGWAQVQWTEMFSALTVAQQLRSAPDLDTRILEDTCEKPRKLAILSVQRLQGQNTSFLEFLQTFRVSESQDPRDKVFAPLGLAPGEVTHDIKVDYERPVSDVYMDVVRALIHLPNVALNFLAYAVPQFGHNPHSLPSWVPDWDYPVTVLPLPKCLHFTLEESGRAIVPYDQRNNLTDFIKGSIQHSVYNTSRGTQVKSFIDGSLLGLCKSGYSCFPLAQREPFINSTHLGGLANDLSPYVQWARADIRLYSWSLLRYHHGRFYPLSTSFPKKSP